MVNQKNKEANEPHTPRIGLRRKPTVTSYYSLLNNPNTEHEGKEQIQNRSKFNKNLTKNVAKPLIKKEPVQFAYGTTSGKDSNEKNLDQNKSSLSSKNTQLDFKIANQKGHLPETHLIDRYKYAVLHIKLGLSIEEACNKYRISKGALLKCLSGGTAPRGKKTRLSESEENEIVDWLINYKDLKYNDAIHLVFEQVEQKFELSKKPNPFSNGKPSMDWWYDFLSRHPQIMASKPDWIMRGKVNDKYIRDVQSGHLKCTKFRRALLSAIQYIRSFSSSNDGLNETSFINNENLNVDVLKDTSNDYLKSETSVKSKKFRTTTNKNQKKSSKIIVDDMKCSKTGQVQVQNNMNSNERSNEDNNETCIDNATFITEIFNSELELENNNFDDLIDQNFLIENGFNEREEYASSIYDINSEHLSSLDYDMLSDHFRVDDSKLEEKNDSINTSQFLNSSFDLHNNLHQINYPHRYYQHLLVPDDDEDED